MPICVSLSERVTGTTFRNIVQDVPVIEDGKLAINPAQLKVTSADGEEKAYVIDVQPGDHQIPLLASLCVLTGEIVASLSMTRVNEQGPKNNATWTVTGPLTLEDLNAWITVLFSTKY